MPLFAVNVTVVPPLETPLVTPVPLICSMGGGEAEPVQLIACQVNPVLVPVSTIFTVVPNRLGEAGKVMSPELADVGVDVAFTAIFQVVEEGTAVVKARVPAFTVVAPE